MIDTPKARELGLPWTLGGSVNATHDRTWGRYQFLRAHRRSYASMDWSGFEQQASAERVAEAAIASTNIVGPRLDTPDRMAALRAVSAMDDETFAVFMGWMRERGFVEMW